MTTWNAPATWIAGQSLSATALNAQVRDNMTHLTEILAWSPTITQGVTVSRTLTHGRYWVSNKRVTCQCFCVISSSGTASQPILLSLPVAAVASSPGLLVVGTGWIYDTASFHLGATLLNSTTTIGVRSHAQPGFVGASPATTLITSALLSVQATYEAA